MLKVYTGSVGPNKLVVEDVEGFFKWDSGSRGFKEMRVKNWGVNVNAVCIEGEKSKGRKKL